MGLKCNNLKCRRNILKICLITNCSHVFCQSCFNMIKKSKICAACKSLCNDSDITIRELEILPNIVGYNPTEILDACRNAISFWEYQNIQESAIFNAINEQADKSLNTLNYEMKSIKANYELEIESLKNTLDRVERSLERERQNNYELNIQLDEKIKQYQKLILNSEKSKYNNRLGDITNMKYNAKDENKL
ncbi:E3 ubiquitin-protein ligase CCNB1IP1 (CIP1) [Vairimorpha necatrix]|uniref:E3 ubiquitin-protein ligase CCNB1IP1 (CIP1) n=1 Tax=Vairimorpha necatrix TaxID=6039 RepID=A0AAX4JAY9_9MICR